MVANWRVKTARSLTPTPFFCRKASLIAFGFFLIEVMEILRLRRYSPTSSRVLASNSPERISPLVDLPFQR